MKSREYREDFLNQTQIQLRVKSKLYEHDDS